MSGERKRGRRSRTEVKEQLLKLLQLQSDSRQLLGELEELSSEITFAGLTPLWGPVLYQRAPKVFRSFILKHFCTYATESNYSVRAIAWSAPEARELEAWLEQVDQNDDVALFTRLYSWKLRSMASRKAGNQAWLADLLAALRKAPGTEQRRTTLEKFDLPFWLDEDTAIALYQMEPNLVEAFILRHLPRPYSIFSGEKRKQWTALGKMLQANGDGHFYFRLYREQVPIKQWAAEALALCAAIENPVKLVAELEKRHPRTWNFDLGDTYCQLLEVRGRDVFGYILPRLKRVTRGWFKGSYSKLLKLAFKNEWWEMWAGLVRTCGGSTEYNKTVREVLELSDQDAKKRLLLLAGLGQEWNFGSLAVASYNPLDDEAATSLYQRFPHLVRGPFKAQINPRPKELYPKLIDTLLQAEDHGLVDYLASRVVTRDGLWGQEKLVSLAESLCAQYEALEGTPEFARRAATVLSQVPPYVMWNYSQVIRRNKLARLLYERRAKLYLDSPEAVTDLLESPEIHAQLLAYRILALPEAGKLAKQSLFLLVGTLLRPLHRRTRRQAFKALANACLDEETAAEVLARAREADHLPDLRYPKEDLVALMAVLLHRFPSLRQASEQPVVYAARRRY